MAKPRFSFRRHTHVELAGKFDFVDSYNAYTRGLLTASRANRSAALQDAVGDEREFEVMGRLQFDLLRFAGLEQEQSLVEIGCGSGRLAVQLRDWLTGSYLGTDVVGDLLRHAKDICGRPDWQFVLVDGLRIPADDRSADMVCAFSVFTHLLHEQSYLYLEDCFRVLRPGGRLVFSFLEFRVPTHWAVMDTNLASLRGERDGQVPHNQFMSADAVEAWAGHLGFELDELFRGDTEYIPIAAPVTFHNGVKFETAASLGQSVAILSRPGTINEAVRAVPCPERP